MAAVVTSQRRTGLHGKVVLDAGTTPTYDGSDILGWKVDLKADAKDVTAAGDRARVLQAGRTSGSGSFDKLVASQLIGTLDVGQICVIELYGGSDADAPDTPLAADTITGTVIITGIGYTSQGDNPEQENVTFEFSGAITTAAV